MKTSTLLYCHDGKRGASNWKGGASYYTVHEAMPMYYWPGASGIKVLLGTLQQHLEKTLDYKHYCKQVSEDPQWNRLRLSIKGLIREPRAVLVFAKNTMLAVRDTCLSMWPAESTSAYTSTHHAFASQEIVSKMNLPKPPILTSSAQSKSLHLTLGTTKGTEELHQVLDKIVSICGSIVDYNKVSTSQLVERGYKVDFVKQVS